MARARNIKPGFFKNEVLAELPLGTRLLFVGLWCLADREGRLEDRPKRIKLELLPFDDFDVSLALDELEGHGFIHRYTIEGVSIIQVVNFAKHQSPHGTERDSELPDKNGCLTVHQRGRNGYITDHQQFDDSGLTVKKRVPNALNPDSLNPDSLNPEYPPTPKGAKREVKPKKLEANSDSLAEVVLPEWVDIEAWEGWLEVRRKKRVPNTARAIRQNLAVLEAEHRAKGDPNAILNRSIASGWTGLFRRETPKQQAASNAREQALASGMWNGRPLTATERYMLENNPSYLPMAAGGG